jgi:hypothetical protein
MTGVGESGRSQELPCPVGALPSQSNPRGETLVHTCGSCYRQRCLYVTCRDAAAPVCWMRANKVVIQGHL